MSNESSQILKGIQKWTDWLVVSRDLNDYIEEHPSYLACEIEFLVCALFTLIHAFRNGGRFVYLWIGLIIHGLNTELIIYNTSDVDNFWHAQSFAMFFGRRMPIYVVLGLYTLFDYTSNIAAKKLQLPWWAEGPAVGLGTVLLDIPYDIMGIKLLWWTWHDTDPNVYDRMYWVPWTSFYYHSSFACSFNWMLRLARNLLLTEEYNWKQVHRELACVVFAGLTAFWVGAFQFLPVYHVFHDFFKVPTECCVMAFLSFYVYLVWIADRYPKATARPEKKKKKNWFDELCLLVVVHYAFYMVIVFLADPENIRATGLHEPIGPCDQWLEVQGVIFDLKLKKQRYLCPTNYDEKIFDFHCLPNGTAPALRDGKPLHWYTQCGTPYPNKAEYAFVIWALCLGGLGIFYQCFARSGELPVPRSVSSIKKSSKEKKNE